MRKGRTEGEGKRKLLFFIIEKRRLRMRIVGGIVVTRVFRRFKMIVPILSRNVYMRVGHQCVACRTGVKVGG